MDLPIAEALARLGGDAELPPRIPSAPSAAAPRASGWRWPWRRTSGRSTRSSAPFDRFIAGERTAIDASAQRGLALFGGKAMCAECHTGVNFTDEAFHCLGVSNDEGRGRVTGKSAELGAFRTPTLREVAHTAPYMHDGSIKTLAEVVEYYDRGGDAHPNLDAKMKRLDLTAQEKADLVAFMSTLSGTVIEGPRRAAAAGR